MAANKIKGLTIEINGETTGLSDALSSVNKKSRDLQGELRDVEKLLRLDPTNTELLAQKQRLLADSVKNTEEKLTTLRAAAEQAQEQLERGDISEEQFRALQREVIRTEQTLESLTGQSERLETSADDAGEEIEEMAENLDDAGDKALSFGDVLKANVIGDAIVGGVKALGGAIKDLAGDALDLADRVQQLSDQYGLSAEKIQELTYVGDTLGVNIDTIAGSYSKLINNMSAATTGTGAAYEAFGRLGVSVTDSNGELRDSQTVWQEAITALGKMENETEATAIAQDIFGRSATDLNPLIHASAEEIAALAQQAHDTGAVMSNETVGALDDFGDSMGQLKQSITGAAGEILSQLTPALGPLIEKLKNIDTKPISDFLNFVLRNASTISAGLAGIAAGFVAFQVVGLIQGLVAAFRAFKLAQEGATLAQWALNSAMLANPIGILIAAVVAITTAIVVLWNTNEDFRDAIIAAWNKVKELVGEAIDSLGTFFQNLLEKIIEVWDGITSKISGAVDSIKTFFTVTIPGAINTMVSFFAGLPGRIWDELQKAINKVKEWGDGIKIWVTETLPGIIKGIPDAFLKVPDQLTQIGRDLIMGLWKGIKEKIDWVLGKIGDFVDSIKNAFTSSDALHIKSPSKWSEGVFKYVMEGGVKGLEKGLPEVLSTVDSATKAIKKAFDSVSYDPAVDYQALIDDATAAGEYARAAQLEQQRNAKIDGERLGNVWGKTSNYASLLESLSTLPAKIEYATTPIAAKAPETSKEDMLKLVSDAVGAALLSGLDAIADNIFEALPEVLQFYFDTQKVAEASWPAFENSAGRRGRMFAPTREQIVAIARSVMPSI